MGDDTKQRAETKVSDRIVKSVPEIGKIVFGVDKQRSYQLAHRGYIPFFRIGNRMLSTVDKTVKHAEAMMEASDSA